MAERISNDLLDVKTYNKLVKRINNPISAKRRAELEQTSKLIKNTIPKIDASGMFK